MPLGFGSKLNLFPNSVFPNNENIKQHTNNSIAMYMNESNDLEITPIITCIECKARRSLATRTTLIVRKMRTVRKA